MALFQATRLVHLSAVDVVIIAFYFVLVLAIRSGRFTATSSLRDADLRTALSTGVRVRRSLHEKCGEGNTLVLTWATNCDGLVCLHTRTSFV
jgi:hypothetical protein